MRIVLTMTIMVLAGAAQAQTTARPGQLSPGPTSNPSSGTGMSGTAGVLGTSPASAPPYSATVPSTPPSGAPPDVVMVPK